MILSLSWDKVWITKKKKLAKSNIQNCFICKQQNVNPGVVAQPMSDLPKEKLSFIEQPFTHTDFDFLRPINVKLTCKQDQTKLHISDMELLTIHVPSI